MYSKITPNLYQSGNPQLYDYLGFEDNINVVINVDRDNAPDLSVYPDIKAYYWLPFSIYPGHTYLDHIIKIIEHHYKGKDTILVHCDNGISGSTMVLAAYFCIQWGFSVQESLFYIKDRRSCVKLDEDLKTCLLKYVRSRDI